jgi:hypothetical protein
MRPKVKEPYHIKVSKSRFENKGSSRESANIAENSKHKITDTF